MTVDQIIEGHRQLIRRAHARGLKIYGGTLTPFEGFNSSGSPFRQRARLKGGKAPGGQRVDSHERRV